MVIYGFEFTQTELILLSAFAVFFAYQLYFYFHYLRAVLRLKKQTAKNRINFEVQKFPVSVIICAKDELDNLQRYFSEKFQKLDIASEYVSSLEGMVDDTRQFDEDLKDLIEIVGTFEEIMMEGSP